MVLGQAVQKTLYNSSYTHVIYKKEFSIQGMQGEYLKKKEKLH
jgi:hypothetical protein